MPFSIYAYIHQCLFPFKWPPCLFPPYLFSQKSDPSQNNALSLHKDTCKEPKNHTSQMKGMGLRLICVQIQLGYASSSTLYTGQWLGQSVGRVSNRTSVALRLGSLLLQGTLPFIGWNVKCLQRENSNNKRCCYGWYRKTRIYFCAHVRIDLERRERFLGSQRNAVGSFL